MSGKGEQSLEMVIDSSIYFVATHYKMSIPEVLAMSPEDFETSVAWGAATKKMEAEEMDKMNRDMKSGTDLASKKRKGDPFPFED